MKTGKNFLNASDVSEYMDISKPMAYKIIRKLNDELKAQGFITVAGKIKKCQPTKTKRIIRGMRSLIIRIGKARPTTLQKEDSLPSELQSNTRENLSSALPAIWI